MSRPLSQTASARWKRRNKAHVKAKLAEWTERNAERRKAYMDDYNHRNKDRIAARDAKRYLTPEAVAKRAAKLEHRRAYNRAWHKANRHKHNAAWAKRKALKRGSSTGNTEVIAEWIKRWRAQEIAKCYWCLNEFPPSECQADHIIPLAKGGAHSIENLCIACISCNQSKHDRTLIFWNTLIEQPVLF